MSDRQLIQNFISDKTGRSFKIESQQSLGGGCINDAFCIQGDGQSYFLKANKLEFLSNFEAESLALAELAKANTVRVPRVIGLLEGDTQSYLILEYIQTLSGGTGNWTELGRKLALLHKRPQPYFGWSQDNFIGASPQSNHRSDSWVSFFGEQRLKKQITLCQSRGYNLPQAKRLLEKLPTFFDQYNPSPSLLHGDLWSGNVSFDSQGSPFVYDPASYYGDRETDLAFTEFFGGFSNEFYEAYQSELPLEPGYQQRKTLYNLYHCLNHAYLFGSSYASQAEHMVRQLLD